MYLPAADTVGFSAGGALKLSLSTTVASLTTGGATTPVSLTLDHGFGTGTLISSRTAASESARVRTNVFTTDIPVLELTTTDGVQFANLSLFEDRLEFDEGALDVDVLMDDDGIATVASVSATAPTYSFTTDRNTGMYSTGADSIGFTAGGTLKVSVTTTTFQQASGSAVASGATIAATGNVFHVTGTTTVTSVTIKPAGTFVTIIFDGVLTFTDGSNLVLAGDFVTTADDTISLCSDGTNWHETARSVN
jgi:hypothetical protein